MSSSRSKALWLGLVVGNSRLHWAAFHRQQWLGTWHTNHLTRHQADTLMAQSFHPASWQSLAEVTQVPLPNQAADELWIASVVASQTQLWQRWPQSHLIEPQHLAIANGYPTLGIDRSLAVLGAGRTYGWPVLVVDAGTALTLTAGTAPSASDQKQLYTLLGGAILPGLSLQAKSLAARADALPATALPATLPPRWSHTTLTAIQSGILYTVLAGIQDYLVHWWAQYPQGQVVFTGGDGPRLWSYLQQTAPDQATAIQVDENVTLWGLCNYRQQIIDG